MRPLRYLLLLLPAVLSGGMGHAQMETAQSVIDVAVFYTPAVRQAQGGTAQITAKIDEMVAGANLAYTASGVNQRINLVAAEEVEGYTEGDGIYTDFGRLLYQADGYLEELFIIRDRVWADLFLLIRTPDSSLGGLAHIMGTESTDFADRAYAVTEINTLFFTHEMGHLMGLNHDRYVQCRNGCPSVAVSAAGYGYVNQEAFESGAASSKRWRTVMSYHEQCSDADFTCTALNRFSNPNQTYPETDGDPMGVALTESNKNSTAVDGPADAVRVLNDTRDTVAEFREGRAVKVSFAAETYAVTEGGSSVTVTVQLDVAPGRTLNIPLTATSTTGAWPGDYTLPASITFGANETSKEFTFSATQDSRQEDAETVTLGFGTPLPDGVTVDTAATAHATATVTVTDDSDDESAAPSVSTVAFSSDPGVAYAAGEEIVVAVVFTKPISVTGAPQLGLTVGTTTRQMTYQADRSGSEVLVFTYTVAADESDPDGVSIAANSLALNGGTIQDQESPPQDATRTHAAVAADSRHRVDGDTPDLESATVDADILTLTYDEALDETSLPAANAFTVTAGSTTLWAASVELSGAVVTLTLGDDVRHTVSVTLAYAPPAETPPLRDAAGNPAATLSSQTVTNNTLRPVYDTDDDGLIGITTLAQLDAIRHDLDGDGTPTAAGATAYAAAFSEATRVICGDTSRRCKGYELLADLDFLDTNGDGQVDTDDDTNEDGQVDAEDTGYWNGGHGWEPIGAIFDPFGTTFEGNGSTLRNLFVNRDTADYVGLVGYMNRSSVIRRVGLINVEVIGGRNVGGLVGANVGGTIRASYATGRVSGTGAGGGLVGRNTTSGTITASYATAQVSGDTAGGGLVGNNGNRGRITASYATGRVSGSADVGGLVGQNGHLARITASYATGRVTGTGGVGGLVGWNSGTARITDSYWDTATSGRTTGGHGAGKSTMELQTPTDDSGIYADWDADEWHFGTASQYPVLKRDFDGDGTVSWEEFGYQLRTGPTAPTVTTDTGLVVLSWTAVSLGSAWDPAPAVSYTVTRNSSVTPIAEGLTASSYTDRTVTRSSTYTYQVAAVVNGGEATRSGRSTEVTAPNQPAAFPSTEDGMRTIAENTPANRNIGAPVAATDPDDTSLTYSLGGTDATSFDINSTSGQLRTKAALNYETKDSYEVTVTVKDGKGVDNAADAMDADDTTDVTITVSDVNEAPEVSGPTSVNYAENSTSAVATYTAMDPETQTITWSVSDPTTFAISTTGVLTFQSPPDFESRNSYTVTVTATDSGGQAASVSVTISIMNLPEAGLVTLTGTPPQVGRQLVAMLSDPDGGLSSITWQWERSLNQSDWTAIATGVSSSGARSSYTPVEGDLTQYLRITAAYTDRSEPDPQSAQAAPTDAVVAAPVVTLRLTPATIAEQDDATTPGTNEAQTVVTARLDKASSAATTVTVSAGDVTLSTNRTLTITAGATESTGQVTLTAVNNDVYEPPPTRSKTVSVGGSATNADGITGPAAVTLEITDDDEPPEVTALRLSATEINEKGTKNSATVTATLSHPSSAQTTVDVAAVATGPTGAGDFTLSPNPTLTFPANTTTSTGTVTITATDDELDAANQTVQVTLTNPDGLTVPDTLDPQLLTITDNEATPTLTLTLTPAAISENGGRSTVTATLNHASSIETEVTVSAEAVSPAVAGDFTLSPNTTLTIAAGDKTSTGRVTLTAEDNALDAPDKEVTVTGEVKSYGLGTIAAATQTLTIEDDDPPEVMGEDTVRVMEGHTTVATYTATTHGGRVMWGVAGAAAAAFRIDQTGNLRFRTPADHETPDTPYTVTVTASDGTRTGELTVSVDVTDAPGELSLAPTAPQAGRAVIATLTDPDDAAGPATDLTWRWERSTKPDPTDPDNVWEPLSSTTDRYMPRGSDVLYYLRVTVDYTDGAGTPKTGVQTISPEAVRAAPRRPPPPPGGGGGGGGPAEESPAAPVGYLENPGRASFQSGIGVISGWVCEAEGVEIELNGVPQEAAYGTERLDTEEVCGDTNNGFGVLFNWNLLGEGEHTVVTSVDGVELGRATVTVTTLGEEFVRGVAGTCEAEDFPSPGETVTLAWQQSQQNFVIVEGPAPSGVNRAGVSDVGYLENPGPHSFQSGVGVLSGWVCDADRVEIEIGNLPVQAAAYGTERLDTEEVCGDTDNGFGLLFNWNRLGEGEHEVTAYVDGAELGWATVRVTTLGAEFLRDVAGECVVDDFPTPGETVTLEWQQTQQNFVIVDSE